MREVASVENLDLLGPRFQADPQRVYEQLRASGAVHHLPRHGWYLVTHAATAREVLRDAECFSPGSTSAPSPRRRSPRRSRRSAHRVGRTSRRWAPTTRPTTRGCAGSSSAGSPPGRWHGWSRWCGRRPKSSLPPSLTARRSIFSRSSPNRCRCGRSRGCWVCRSRDAQTSAIGRWLRRRRSAACPTGRRGSTTSGRCCTTSRRWPQRSRTCAAIPGTACSRRWCRPPMPRGPARTRSRWRSCSPCYASWSSRATRPAAS